MIIRNFILSDLDDVVRIEFDVFDDPYPIDVLVQLYNVGCGFLVAEISGMVIGYVIFWIKEGFGHIIAIGVDSKYQDMHVGSLLLEKAIYIFHRNNIFKIRLEVRKSNIRARKFYCRRGFVQVDEEDNYYNDGEAAIIMEYSKHET